MVSVHFGAVSVHSGVSLIGSHLFLGKYLSRTTTTLFQGSRAARSAGDRRPPKWRMYWGVVAGAGAGGAEGTGGLVGQEWGPGS